VGAKSKIDAQRLGKSDPNSQNHSAWRLFFIDLSIPTVNGLDLLACSKNDHFQYAFKPRIRFPAGEW
jgi:hypothetical protein